MLKLVIFLLILAPISASYAQLQSSCVNKLVRLQKKFRARRTLYYCGRCFYNSGEFTRWMQEGLQEEVDIDDVWIWMIRHQNAAQNPLIPYATGSEVPLAWAYHAVIYYQGSIIDLDLASHEVLSVREYLNLQFPPRRGINQHAQFEVAQIPASDYLAQYRAAGLFHQHVSTPIVFNRDYPFVPLETVISSD